MKRQQTSSPPHFSSRLLMACLLGCFLFGGSPLAQAQLSWRIGYNVGWTSSDGFDESIRRFNEARPWLDTQLEEISYLDGFLFGFRIKYFELLWSGKTRLYEVGGIPPGGSPRRWAVDVKQNSVILNGAYPFWTKEEIGLSLEAGASIDYTYNLVRTRQTDEVEWTDAGSARGLSSHAFVNVTWRVARPLSLSVSPYFQIPWFQTDLSDMPGILVPNTPAPAEGEFEERLYVNYGLMLSFYAHF
ncbi:MAG: hypothetical protein AAFV95_00325 [Bacteroidota bacterium]